MKKLHPTIKIGLMIVLAAFFATGIYTIIDNQRVRVVRETVQIERLPEAFDGFTILQISDLHGKYFGEQQKRLIERINALDVDLIAFTGDMNKSDSKDNSEESAAVILTLIEGIENKSAMFWVDGNTGPYTMDSICDIYSGSLTDIGIHLEEKGVRLLTEPVPLTRSGEQIWITPVRSEMLFSCYRASIDLVGLEDPSAAEASLEKAVQQFNRLRNNGEVKILLKHVPFQTNLTESEISMDPHLDYDLVLAGHYHGGQLRLPLIGALYIPSPTTGINNSGFLPDQSAVKGISYFGDTPQYVSAGLGSSSHAELLDFRLFNTPEINLITLMNE